MKATTTTKIQIIAYPNQRVYRLRINVSTNQTIQYLLHLESPYILLHFHESPQKLM